MFGGFDPSQIRIKIKNENVTCLLCVKTLVISFEVRDRLGLYFERHVYDYGSVSETICPGLPAGLLDICHRGWKGDRQVR